MIINRMITNEYEIFSNIVRTNSRCNSYTDLDEQLTDRKYFKENINILNESIHHTM